MVAVRVFSRLILISIKRSVSADQELRLPELSMDKLQVRQERAQIVLTTLADVEATVEVAAAAAAVAVGVVSAEASVVEAAVSAAAISLII
jgi:hypothetical protein